jgi:hypothetical protein
MASPHLAYYVFPLPYLIMLPPPLTYYVSPHLMLYVNAVVSAGDNEIGINLINTPALTYNITNEFTVL